LHTNTWRRAGNLSRTLEARFVRKSGFRHSC